jgi:bile acid-coenzyme A ligase
VTVTLSVAARIAGTARDRPGQAALVGYGPDLAEQVLSWPEFAGQVAETAGALRGALAPGTGSCAVVPAANTVPAAVAITAALAAGVPVFPLNPGTPPGERDALLGLLGARFGHGYLIDDRLRPRRIDLGTPPGPPGTSTGAGTPAGGGGGAGEVAYLLATGGSTGVPRIWARPGPLRYDPARVPSLVIRQAGWRTGQRQLIVGPLYHAAPFTSFLDAVLDAGTVVLQPVFAAAWTAELIRAHRIEWLQLTPAHMREILRVPGLDPAWFASVRAMLHTAAPCDAGTKHAWITLLGPRRVYELYGAT